MMLTLSVKNKPNFVNETITAPEKTSPDYKELRVVQWSCDHMVNF